MNVWPTNMESMRISYGGSEVLRCTVQLAYDRFFTEFDKSNIVENIQDRGIISNVPIYERSDELNAITKISADNNIPTYEKNRQRQRNFR